MDLTPPSQAERQRYAYMFHAGNGKRFLFIRNLGHGCESIAQLVEDLDTGDVMVRKVLLSRLRRDPKRLDQPCRLKLPKEFEILDMLKTFEVKDPDNPPFLPECFLHEYILGHGPAGEPRYSSVSYWKLYNGGTVYRRWVLPNEKAGPPPVGIVARMCRQVLSTLHFMYTGGPQPIYHGDLHADNVWMHWPLGQHLPDFYLGDFGQSKLHGLANPASADDVECLAVHLDAILEVVRPGWNKRRDNGDFDVAGDLAGSLLQKLWCAMKMTQREWRSRRVGAGRPPAVEHLIGMARTVESLCTDANRSNPHTEIFSTVYHRYVQVSQKEAHGLHWESAHTIRVTKEQALRPIDYLGDMPSKPLPIHGPWYLLRVNWVLADPKLHHRPNGPRGDTDRLSLHDFDSRSGGYYSHVQELTSDQVSTGLTQAEPVPQSAVWEEPSDAVQEHPQREPFSWEMGSDVAPMQELALVRLVQAESTSSSEATSSSVSWNDETTAVVLARTFHPTSSEALNDLYDQHKTAHEHGCQCGNDGHIFDHWIAARAEVELLEKLKAQFHTG